MMQELVNGAEELINLSTKRVQNCITGFVLLSSADGYGSRAEICRMQLDWQHYHFHRWAAIVGLFHYPPELNVSNLVLVARTLQKLEHVLSDFSCLHDDYGLRIEDTQEELEFTHNSNALFGDLHILPNVASKAFVSSTFESYQRRSSIWKKLRWVAFNHVMFERLLADIGFFNEQLRTILQTVDQDEYAGASNHTIRALIAQSTRQAILDVVGEKLEAIDDAVSAAARLKKKSLLLNVLEDAPRGIPVHPQAERLTFDNVTIAGQAQAVLGGIYNTHTHTHTHVHIHNSDSSLLPTATSSVPNLNTAVDSGQQGLKFVPHPQPMPAKGRISINKSLKKDYKDLNSHGLGTRAERYELATFHNREVVIEWKDLPPALEGRLKYRVAAVAELLSSMTDSAFHSLRCIGHTRQPKTTRYGYIFEIPHNAEPSLLTLHDLLLIDSLKPSLNQRLTLAIALVETILQFHTAGWLHKSIRPDNMLFFGNISTFDLDKALMMPYLGGFEFARLDQPSETTEAPSVQDFARLYRHPLSLSEDRIPFCKAFDLYSIGCVLLEIGLWHPLATVLHGWVMAADQTKYRVHEHGACIQPTTETHWHDILAEKQGLLSNIMTNFLGNELHFLMGARYAAVVAKCLNAIPQSLNEPNENDDDILDESEFCLTTQIELLRDLRAMLQGL